jgi:hypothetical protein
MNGEKGCRRQEVNTEVMLLCVHQCYTDACVVEEKSIDTREIKVILYVTRKSQGSTALRDFPWIIANPEPGQASLLGTVN